MGMSVVSPALLRIADERDDIWIRPEKPGPVVCTSWDPGAAEIREQSTSIVGGDGVVDESYYTGARTLTFDLVVFGDDTDSPYGYVERLAAFTHPTRRPYLYAARAQDPNSRGEEWRMQLRGNPYSITYGRRAAALLELQLVFTAPGGYFESPARGPDIDATAGTPGSSLSFPATFPVAFARGRVESSGAAALTIGGHAPVSPTIALYGPMSGTFVAVSDSYGHQFVINKVLLEAGDSVVIDMAAGTVWMQGDPARSVYHLVDWRLSTFWRWPPGPVAVTSTGAAQMKIRWRDKRLTL